MTEVSSEHDLSAHDKRVRRLLFRATHRGIKEMDILLGGYAEAHLNEMSSEKLDEFEMMLTIHDQKFYSILLGDEAVPAGFEGELMDALIHYTHNRLKS